MHYTVTIFAVMVASFAYQIRHAGIFACPGNLHAEDYYLGHCQGASYGAYDHGAFWFDLEPDAVEHAAAVEVLFLGNSRMAFGLSAPELGHWFSDNHAHSCLDSVTMKTEIFCDHFWRGSTRGLELTRSMSVMPSLFE